MALPTHVQHGLFHTGQDKAATFTLAPDLQGVKLELFIFDPFHLATRLCLVEVERAAQFAPVKVRVP